jgi:hypothetical protein
MMDAVLKELRNALAGRASLVRWTDQGSDRMFLAGVGDQALSSAGFAMLRMVSRCRRPARHPARGSRRPAGTLTFRCWRVDRPLDGGVARQPALRIKTGDKTAQDRHRCRPVERPSEAATGFITPDVNRVRRDPAAARPGAGRPAPSRGRAKPGGSLLTPTPARPSCRSPFDPIEGDAFRRGDLLLSGGIGRDR